MRADVAEALDGDPRARDAAAQPAQQLERETAHAAAGGLVATGNAVIVDGLARDAGRREAVVLVVLVHDPRHHFRRAAHVGGGDVDVGADEIVDRVDEPAGHPLQFP